MNTPCEKTEVIEMIREDVTEIKTDVKTLLLCHYQNMGKTKLRRTLLKETIRFIGIVATVIGYLKFR